VADAKAPKINDALTRLAIEPPKQRSTTEQAAQSSVLNGLC
jgi:hypothetical protein